MFPAVDNRHQHSSGDRKIKRLLIRPGGIGDCILALPAMRYLQAEYTEVWVPSAVVPLIQFADKVSSIAGTGIDTFGIEGAPSREGFVDRLRGFDQVVSWYGSNRDEFREAMQRAGVNCKFHTALPSLDDGTHASDFFALQVGAQLGQVPQLKFNDVATRGSMVIHPFSGSRGKNWPLRKYEQLAAEISTPVEWLAGPEEELAGAFRFADLGTLAAWLVGARAYVGNDSGVTHLAAAVGISTVALFGPTDPSIWQPRGPRVVVIRHQPLEELSVELVRSLASANFG